MNTSYSCLDRHIAENRGNQAALIYDSSVKDTLKTCTKKSLTDLRGYSILIRESIVKGDRHLYA
jgi:propionyl-CoA synthetase